MDIRDYIEEDLLEKFEFYNYNHAIEIITQAFPEEWSDIVSCLRALEITTDDLRKAGGNETDIPKKFDDVLYPLDWKEIKIAGDLHIKFYPRRGEQRGRFSDVPYDEKIVPGYIDGHNIDFVKGRVAFDLEWNSKDQTFDRDLMAMRTYYEFGIISAGVIITRGTDIKTFPKHYGLNKYGASTTWMGKLTYRLDSRRSGGCPVLAIGITSKCIEGFEED